jgi:glycolate oxidase
MALSKEIYQKLQTIAGTEYISQDPVICEAYTITRGGYGKDMGLERVLGKKPVCVILPGTTQEIQEILKFANRHTIPYVAASSYSIIHAGARVNDCMLIDLKRMNRLEIDDTHMYALVEPGVIYSQLQAQAMQRGLYITVPGGGSQVSVLANHLMWGLSPLNYRQGMACRRILGADWVLPDGELLKLGSRATGEDYFWGDGLGIDIRGLVRGWVGWFGGMGIVTRMAVKLQPFQPEPLKPIGISPETTLQLPCNRMRWYNFTMPDQKSLLDALHEIGKSEIAAAATRVPALWRYLAQAKDKQDFWRKWDKLDKEKINNTHIIRVLLIGYTSEAQLAYEERVLMDIMEEYNGTLRRTRQTDQSWIQSADSVRMWAMTGGYVSVELYIDTILSSLKIGEKVAEIRKSFTPPLMEDYGDPGWFQIIELGHMGYVESLVYFDPNEADDRRVADRIAYIEIPKEDIRWGGLNGFMLQQSPLYLTGPAYGPNFHLWMLKIKKAFDTHNISNPPFPFDVDYLVEDVDWLRKDW